MSGESTIFHITSAALWAQALQNGEYAAETLATEGFIHCSTRGQVAGVANRVFHGQEGLVVLQINPAEIGAEVRYENLSGEAELFPHIYGTLPVRAVTKVAPFVASESGEFTFEP